MQSFNSFFDTVAGLRVLVIGDMMLDRYVQGSVTRVSPEAPVPVVRLSKRWSSPGGAGHVAACLTGLGVQVTAIGLAGQDAAADELLEVLGRANVGADLVQSSRIGTVTKTRVIAGDKHQLLRIDEEADSVEEGPEAARVAELLLSKGLAHLPACDAVVLSDYDKGTLSTTFLHDFMQAARRAGKPVVVDPKKIDFAAYRGATAITPNTFETERAIGRRLLDGHDAARTAVQLKDLHGIGAVIITRGAQGLTGADGEGRFHVPAQVREVADVTGAGDTVVAVLAAALAAGADVRVGCELAGIAAGIAVSHRGTYVVRIDELRAATIGQSSKIVSWDAAAVAIREAQAQGRTVVFTNGCFDILHTGHLHSLTQARKLGDLLVVGLNSDQSVRSLKGPSRPINNQGERATLLAGFSCVDQIVLFDEDRPEKLIRYLAPDILAKGGDYRPEDLAGSEFVAARGGKVVIIPLVPGLSTTRLIDRAGLGAAARAAEGAT